MGYLVVTVMAYLLGCSNMALYLSKWKRTDLRGGGSGNLGASNAVILMGWPAGIATAVHDIGKGALAVILARLLYPELEYIGAVAGIASVLGHIFPFYLGFRGGKGFASYVGMVLALNWKFALVVMALVVIVTLITDYIVAGTMTTIFLTPAYLGFTCHSWLLALILSIGTGVIIFKHWENFKRILNGTEIGLRSAAKGKHRTT